MSVRVSNKKYAVKYDNGLNNKDIIVTRNGNYQAESNYTGLGVVRVKIPFEQITVDPSIESQTIYPNSGYEAISQITVNPITIDIDENIKPENIREGVTILGVTGNCHAAILTTLNTTENGTYLPEEPYTGFSEVNINVDTAVNMDITITENGVYTPQEPYTGFGTIVVRTLEPSGTINITQNGTYDVTNYASANVSIGSGVYRISRIVKSYMYNTQVITTLTHDGINRFQLPQGITNLDTRALAGIFWGCTSLELVDLSSLTTISGYDALASAFQGCTLLSFVDFSNLTTISGSYALSHTFVNCTSLTSISFPSLTTINNPNEPVLYLTFYGCTSLTSVEFPNLTTISGSGALSNTFFGCTSLISVDLSSLNKIQRNQILTNTFSGCTSLRNLNFPALTSNSFGSYKTQFNNMLSNVTGCTVHFPSNLQSVIGSWADVTSGFGGTNTIVLFDLPATS